MKKPIGQAGFSSTVKKGRSWKLKKFNGWYSEENVGTQSLWSVFDGLQLNKQKLSIVGKFTFAVWFRKEFSNYKRWLIWRLESPSWTLRPMERAIIRKCFHSFRMWVIAIRIESGASPETFLFRPTFVAQSKPIRTMELIISNEWLGCRWFDVYRQIRTDYLGATGQTSLRCAWKLARRWQYTSWWLYATCIKANAVTIYFAAATNFVKYNDVSGNEHARVENYLKNIAQNPASQIKSAHIKDFQQLFARTSLTLPLTANSYLPTDERMVKFDRTRCCHGRFVLSV